LRVGVIGPVFPDSMADNILHALPALGVEGVSLGPSGPQLGGRIGHHTVHALRRLSADGERMAQRALTRRARNARCDLVLSVDQSLLPETVQALRGRSTRTALWFPDAISNIGRQAMIASEYDGLFLKDPLFVVRLNSVYGLPAHYLPEACTPAWHRPTGTSAADPHIAVVGNLYPTRTVLLRRLLDAGVPLRLYGGGFPRLSEPGPLVALHTGTAVFREDKARVFREARGVLNNLHPAEMSSVNCRLFEAAGSGGAVLCERRPTLADLFVEGEEVLAFDTFQELLGHCQALMADPSLTTQIGNAASVRAHRDHTYQIRLAEILERLG